MTFRPIFHSQLDGTRCASWNCVPTSFGYAWQRDARGANPRKTAAPWPPLPAFVVDKVYDGGACRAISSGEADVVGRTWYGIDLAHYTRLPIGDAVTLSKAGHGIALTIRYSALHGTPQDSCPTFDTNHKVYLNEINAAGTHGLVYDPLANGRFLSSVSRDALAGPQWWPLALLWKAAGLVDLGSGSTTGAGFVYCDVTRDTEEEAKPVAVVDRDKLAAPNPRRFVIPPNVKVNGYDPGKPDTVVKSYGPSTTGMDGHADTTATISWPGDSTPPIPRGGLFLHVVDGLFAGLYIALAQVALDPADQPTGPDQAALTAAYNAGVDAAALEAGKARKP